MKFYPIPDPRSGSVTPQMLSDLQQIGLLPRSIGAFASTASFQEVSPVLPPVNGDAKYWRDNAVFWDQRESYDYIMLARNADGSYAHNILLSQPNMDIYSQSTINFYLEYSSHFKYIPSFVVKTFNRGEASRLSFAPGVPMDFPVGTYICDSEGHSTKLHTIPGSLALRFNPQTGQVEAFSVEEYIRTYPLDHSTRSTTQSLSDGELVSAVSIVMASPLDVTKKAAAIRQLAA